MNRTPMTVYVYEIGDCSLPHDGQHHPHHVYRFPEDRFNPSNPDRNTCLKCGEPITITKES